MSSVTLRPYQQEAVDSVERDWASGFRSVLGTAATGAGKAEPMDALVLTENGWALMQDLRRGRRVIGSDGKGHAITGLFPQGNRPVYAVLFSDGTIVECTADHLWSVQTKSQKARASGFFTKRLCDLIGDTHDGSGARKWFLPIVDMVQFARQASVLPIAPYALGALLGDGSFRNRHVSLSNPDSQVRDRVSSELGLKLKLLQPPNPYDYAVVQQAYRGQYGRGGAPLGRQLHCFGLDGKLSYEKSIPPQYMLASVEDRLDMLRGLMDTDGYCPDGGKAPEFCTTSVALADGVCEIVRSLGGVTRIRTKEHPRYTYRGEVRIGRPAYLITVSLPMCPFYLARKAARWNPHPKQGRTKAVERIDYVGEKPCQCISVDAADGLYVTDGYTLTHNTHIFLDLLTRALAGSDKRGLILAHRKELVEQPLERLDTFYGDWSMKAGIVMAERDDCDKQITSATVQTLASPARLDRYLRNGPVDYLITDECFPAGTLVDGRPIESVCVGDTVTAWDEGLGISIAGRVTRCFSRPAPDTMIEIRAAGRHIVCTSGHPLWVNGGWKPAYAVHIGDSMVQCLMEVDHGIRQLQQMENVRSMRGGCDQSQRGSMPTLRRGCQENKAGDANLLRVRAGVRADKGTIRCVDTNEKRAGLLLEGMLGQGVGKNVIGAHGPHESQVCICSHESQESDAQPSIKSQDADDAPRYGLEASGAWRQRQRANGPSAFSGLSSGMADGGRGQDGTLQRRHGLPDLLQARHRQRNAKIGDRGRRRFSLCPVETGSGPKEGRVSAIARVDRVEVLESRGDRTFGGLCPDGLVYNLEVECWHTYTANGLVVHNCAHAVADTYVTLFERLREANPEMYHLGVTATPQRADERGLAEVYEKESFHFGIKELVSDGWLVPPRWLAIKTGISLAGVKTGSNGDFNGKQLADVFEVDNCFDLVVESHQRYAAERQALAFVQSVAGAYRLAEKFREAGISAEAADGTTRKSLRADILGNFRAGKTQVLVNVGLYTEGLDVPRVSCIHQVRPTQSDGLYIQMIGRGLRIVPGKNDCVILDYAPVEYRNIVMLGDVLGSKVRKDAYIRDDDAEPGDAIGGMTFDGQVKFMHGSAEELISEKLDYLELTPWSWFSGDNGWLSLGLGEGPDGHNRQMVIAPSDTEGEFVMWKVYRPKDSRRWVVRKGEQADFGTLGEIGESLADKFGNATLAVKSMRWRRQSASAKQLDFARRLGIEKSDLSKGECAQRITHALACRQVRQAMGR